MPIDDPHPPTRAEAIFAPWRMAYLESLVPAPAAASSGSFLRAYWLDPSRDDPNHVVARTADGLILLNRYPYANGHLLVALGEAKPRLLDYHASQRASLWRMVDRAAALLDAALHPQGINIGINEGRAAGAGVPDHLHVHLVPRWGGDTNFINVVGQIRVIPSSLEAMAERFRAVWATLGQG